MRSTVLLIILVLSIGKLHAQQSVSKRYEYQQKFITSQLISKNTPAVKTTGDIDSLFTRLNQSWKQYVTDSLGNTSVYPATVMSIIDPYAYLWTLNNINRQAKLDKALEFHVYKNYMLPSLRKDFFAVRANTGLINQGLIWPTSLTSTMTIGLNNYSDSPSMTLLYDILVGLRTLIYTVDNASETNAGKLLSMINANEYEIEAKNHYAKDGVDVAFTYLISGLSTNKFPKSQAITFSKALVDYYAARRDLDKSVAILNNLSISTTQAELSRETLKGWYYALDKTEGPKWYSLMANKLVK